MSLIEHNAIKLAELRPPMSLLVQAILLELQAAGYQPKIVWAYRSAEDQLKKFEKGYSKTARPGYHHWGLGCDIIDRRWGWKVTDDNAHFFLTLRSLCDKYNLASGGWWGVQRDFEGSAWKRWGIGWDCCHAQFIGAPDSWKSEYRP